MFLTSKFANGWSLNKGRILDTITYLALNHCARVISRRVSIYKGDAPINNSGVDTLGFLYKSARTPREILFNCW